MGNRHTDKTVSITARAAAKMAIGLRLIADEYDRLAQAMGDKEIVEAAGLITGMEGLARIAKFCGNVQEAYCLTHALDSVAEEIAGAKFALLSRIDRLKDEALAAKQADESKLLNPAAITDDPENFPKGSMEQPPKRKKSETSEGR